jgi:prolyl-tRNA synthetase
MAAAAEQYHDDAGLRWPKALAPFHVVVIPTNMDQPAVVSEAERIYEELVSSRAEVVLDDRDATAGVKFADADLIGLPIRLTVSKRTLEQQGVELKLRDSSSASTTPIAKAVAEVRAIVQQRLAESPL